MLRSTLRLLRAHAAIASAVMAYAVIIGGLAAARHYTFQTQAFDLGVFDQIFWNTIHGRFFENSLEGGSHLETHFTPFLILLVPIYWLIPSAYTLLWLQTAAIALGALPLFALARDILGRRLAYAIVASYLLYPWLHALNLFDFHEEPFAIPLILAAFYYLRRQRLWRTALSLGLAALTKENTALAVAGVGIFFLAFHKNKRFAALLTLGVAVYLGIISELLMVGRGGRLFQVRYGNLGATPAEAIRNLFSSPRLVAGILFTKAKLAYLLRLFGPLGFLPLLAPATVVLLLFPLAQNLLSNYPQQFSNRYQYDALIIPFLYIGLIYACRNLSVRWPLKTRFLSQAITGLAIAAYLALSPASPIKLPWPAYRDRERAAALREIIKLVPPNASVAADANLVPHLTRREHAYIIGSEPFLTDIVAFDGADPFPFASIEELQRYADTIAESGQYRLTTIGRRFFVFTKIGLATDG